MNSETPAVGQTWLSAGRRLFRVVDTSDPCFVLAECIGQIDRDGSAHPTNPEPWKFCLFEFANRRWRIVSRDPQKYDEYLKSLSKTEETR